VVPKVANGRRVGRQTEPADNISMTTIKGEVRSASLRKTQNLPPEKNKFSIGETKK